MSGLCLSIFVAFRVFALLLLGTRIVLVLVLVLVFVFVFVGAVRGRSVVL